MKSFYFHLTQEVAQDSDRLNQLLSDDKVEMVFCEPYIKQVKLAPLLGSSNPLSTAIVKNFMLRHDVNLSNRYGLTLLHNLIWFGRPDLATVLLQHPQFDKINYQFCIPLTAGYSCATALELALILWLEKEGDIELSFIENLLKAGSFFPELNKKIMEKELLEHFYPIIIDQLKFYPFFMPKSTLLEKMNLAMPTASDSQTEVKANDSMQKQNASQPDLMKMMVRTPEELISLLSLLNNYGFNLKTFFVYFKMRLFTEKAWEDWGQEEAVQQEKLEGFIKKAMEFANQHYQSKTVQVEMTDARKNTGYATVNLLAGLDDKSCRMM